MNAGVLRDALSATYASTVILDLGPLDFMDSAALRVLDAGNRELEAVGRRTHGRCSPGVAGRVHAPCGGFPDGAVFDSVDSVVRAVGA